MDYLRIVHDDVDGYAIVDGDAFEATWEPLGWRVEAEAAAPTGVNENPPEPMDPPFVAPPVPELDTTDIAIGASSRPDIPPPEAARRPRRTRRTKES